MKRETENWKCAAISISPPMESQTALLRKLWTEAFSAGGFDAKRVARRKPQVRRFRMGLDITWVTDRIGVGGGIWTAENMAAVARNGITHIIDMQIEFDDTPLAEPHGIEVCWNPIDDDFELKPPEVFERGVKFGLAALDEDGSKLYVHCAAGVHRAPMMTLALLGVMGWKMEDALDLIEGRRPVADFADVYVRSVENFLQGRRV
ncbi:MAG: dual specificity protein phosphatase [Candidatus Sulfotelmatobacter sp.]|jgi:protein-tyrosine phosphatase